MARTFWGLLAALLLCAAPALGQEADATAGPDFLPDGWFLGAGGTWGMEDFKGSDLDGRNNEWGGHVYAGWRFARYFSGDVHFEYIDDFRVRDANINGFSNGVKAERFYNLTLNFRAYAPLDRLSDGLARIQPYVSAGGGLFHARTKDPSSQRSGSRERGRFAGRFGGGIDFAVTEKIVLNTSLNYYVPTGSLDDLKYMSLGAGLAYRFGGGD